MLSNEITAIAGSHRKRKRIGRGNGSGYGKTSGRGHKGCGQRAGTTGRASFEGGQMPLFRRFPKRGFSNVNFAKRFEIVNLSQLERCFEDGTSISVAELAKAGLVDNATSRVKVLGDGDLTKKLIVSAQKFSKSAEQKISGCGGETKVVA